MKNTDFAQSLQKFFTEYLALQQEHRENTVKSYRDTFKLFILFMSVKKSIGVNKMLLKHFTSDAVNEYVKYLLQIRKNSGRTVNQRLAALHSFAKFLQYEHPENIVQWQKILTLPMRCYTKKPVSYLKEDDLVKLISSIKTNTKSGLRNRTLLFILYDTGARVQEVVDLKVGDVRLAAPAQVILHGKGNKVRITPLQKEAVRLLKEYIDIFELTKESESAKPLFRNRFGEKMTRFGVTYLLNKYGENTVEKTSSRSGRPTPHQLRHSKAMHMLKTGIPTEVIQKFLGHTDIKSTAIYAQADLDMVRSALEKLEQRKNGKSNTASVNRPSWLNDATLLDWLNDL